MELKEIIGKGFKKYYWENHEGKMVSPYFGSKDRAKEWYGLHENWLESPAILEPTKRDTDETE